MKNIVAGVATASMFSVADMNQFAEWAEASRPLTRMDPDVVGYPRSAILVAGDDAVTAYATVQSLMFVDNFIPRPGLEDRKRALSLIRFEQLLEKIAADTAHREIMFTTKDKDYAAVACKRGWREQSGMIVLRKKVGEPHGRR